MLLLRFKKFPDGASTLTCTRPDGSVTWQRQHGPHARFFIRHDLTHFAVETILNYRLGFYGLLAQGWSFTDFGAPWPRGPIPPDANPAELIVGFLDADQTSPIHVSADQLNDHAATFYRSLGAANPPVLTQDQLSRIRSRLHDLLNQLDSIQPGQALELSFDPDGKVDAAA
jgi:hypothetical protein